MRSFSLISIVLFTACGGGSGGNLESTGVCDTICDHDLACDPQGSCDPTCEQFEAKLRPEAAAAIAGCYQSLSCGSSDDQCFVDGTEAVTPRDLDDTYAERCGAAVDACQITDDFCFVSELFEAPHVEDALACFDLECADIEPCLDDLFGF